MLAVFRAAFFCDLLSLFHCLLQFGGKFFSFLLLEHLTLPLLLLRPKFVILQ
jgi:hypothetical protein